LNASGQPLTVGRIFAVLSGQSRASAPLEGDDRLNFTQILSKWGFHKDEAEEILGLTDEGGTAAAWKRIAAKLRALGGEANEAHVTEISALLKGLDMPEEMQRQILQAFAKTDSLSLSGEQLEALLAPAAHKTAARENARESVQPLMREAMAQALENGKLKERNDPVADTRGSRRSEQAQALMLHSVREKVGGPFADAASGEKSGSLAAAAASGGKSGSLPAESAPDGKSDESFAESAPDRNKAEPRSREGSRTESLSAANPDRNASSRRETGNSALDRLMQRIDAAAGAPQGGQNPGTSAQASAQDLNSLSRNFRQEIFSQVENGFLQQAGNGGRQLTLQLNPQELGRITLILSVNQGEVKASIRAENGETAAVLTEQMAELKASLEAQGLKVRELDVQTQTQNNEFSGQWTREHNLMQDARERARMMRLSHLRRETEAAARTIPGTGAAEETGLHIVA
jgi:flagellar hook-length control protein FliK